MIQNPVLATPKREALRFMSGWFVLVRNVRKDMLCKKLAQVGVGCCLGPVFMLSALISVVTKQWKTVSVIIKIGMFAVVIHSFTCKTIL